ncbi:uncharacterized protein ACRADG_011518 [Cochliomyia hominivorax]
MLMKPYKYQIFDDDTPELIDEHNAVAIPMWQTVDKQQYYFKRLPVYNKHGSNSNNNNNKNNNNENRGNAMTSEEITFENLNDFDGYNKYKIKNAIWPKTLQQEQQLKQQRQHFKVQDNNDNQLQQQHLARHRLQQFLLLQNLMGNTNPNRYENPNNFKTKNKRITKNSKTTKATSNSPINAKTTTVNDSKERSEEGKENLFPLKDKITLNVNDNEDEVEDDDNDGGDDVNVTTYNETEEDENERADAGNKNIGIANSNGNGNENLNYADNNELKTNYNKLMMMMMTQNPNNDHNRNRLHHQFTRMTAKKHLQRKGNIRAFDKRAKPSIGHTPFLPAVSGGAMTNLGKFFRDLSKNVHVSEQYQWNAEEQKLLEGDPNFGNIQHHLTKPNAATDQQTAEWIKAIRFYRPSQKIRSLVAMNPHGQWDHSSQFIDPNYMWVGLGK